MNQYSRHTEDNRRCSATCVMSSLHGPVVVTHCIQVIKVVLWVPTHPIWPSPWWPVRGEAPAALAPLHHVWCHVHTCEWELHHVLNLHSPIPILKLGQDKAVQSKVSSFISSLSYETVYTSLPVWSVSGEVWGCPAGSTDWAWCCPAEVAYSVDNATHHQERAANN